MSQLPDTALHRYRDPPLLPQQPLRPEEQDNHDERSQDEVPYEEDAVLEHLRQVIALELLGDDPEPPDHVCAQDGAPVIAGAADDEHGPKDERAEEVG